MELIVVIVFLFAVWKLYEEVYDTSKKFKEIKSNIKVYTANCNELNNHIEKLKSTYLGIDQLDYGHSTFYDNSKWHYKRPELKKQQYSSNIYNCSRTVCDNTRK